MANGPEDPEDGGSSLDDLENMVDDQIEDNGDDDNDNGDGE